MKSEANSGPEPDHVQLAENARRSGQWKEAAAQLEQAASETESAEAKAHLLWCQVECFLVADELRLARKAAQHAGLFGMPTTASQWCAAARMSSSHTNPRFVLNTVLQGIERYPGNTELIAHLERLCNETNSWESARGVTRRVIDAADSPDSRERAIHLACATALALRDSDLSADAATLVLKNSDILSPRYEYLRTFAATVLACLGTLSPEQALKLLNGAHRRAHVRRINLAASWAFLRDGRWAEAAEFLRSLAGTGLSANSPGLHWRRLDREVFRLAENWKLAAYHHVYELAYDDLRARLRKGNPHPGLLHAFALVNLAIANRHEEQGLREAAAAKFREAIGAWAAFLSDDHALIRFSTLRWACYAHPAGLPESFSLSESIGNFIENLMDRYIGSEQLRMLWHLEKHAMSRMIGAGGLLLRKGALIHAGPLLANALGLHRSVRSIADREVGILYSPLGSLIILLKHHRFDAVNHELVRIGSAPDQEGWRLEDYNRILLDSHLESARELVARVPIDIENVAKGWKWSFEAARAAGMEEYAGKSIRETALGRVEVLFERRTREQHRADPDRRNLLTRRREALQLMDLALEITGEPTVRHACAYYQNWFGVDAADNGQYDEAVSSFRRAVTVFPGHSHAAMNLAKCVRRARRLKIEQNLCDEAGLLVLDSLNGIRALDAGRETPAIGEAIVMLDHYGPVPFVDLAVEAMEKCDWKLATSAMTWALRISPSHPYVAEHANEIYREFRLAVNNGNTALQPFLEDLTRNMPKLQ